MARDLSVEIVGAGELRDLSRALRKQADGRERTKELRRGLRDVGKPLVPAIRSRIRAMPSRGESRRRGRKSLRAEMARSVTLQVRTSGTRAGVSVFMSPKKMPDGKRALPGYFEQVPGKTRLRHPVFGDRETWVTQSVPAAGYFTHTIRPAEEQAVQAARKVVDRTARRIEDS
jgi:hypothetical protein